MRRRHWMGPASAVVLALALSTGIAAQDPNDANSQGPKVERRTVDIWSDGTRISGTVTRLAGQGEELLPALLLSHGWGGTRDHLDGAYAPDFARAGFVVLTIDYRGWGDSDSRLVIEGEAPKPGEDGMVDLTGVKVKALREIVDPFDQTEDIRNALTWLEGEPGVDAERIGLWGSSYSGGHVIWVAAHDSRVKATVSQVGSQDSIGIFTEAGTLGGLEGAHDLAIRRARGDAKPYADTPARPGLRGTPAYTRMMHYSPRQVAHRSQAASLFIDAGEEELFDISEHGRAVFAVLRNRVPAKYVEIEGITHYGIYQEARPRAVELAIDWFREHL